MYTYIYAEYKFSTHKHIKANKLISGYTSALNHTPRTQQPQNIHRDKHALATNTVHKGSCSGIYIHTHIYVYYIYMYIYQMR